jgi:hypothetical protein
MLLVACAALLGAVAGTLAAAGLLRLGLAVVRQMTAPKVFEMEHWVIYVGLLLGAGFGAVSGALTGLAGTLSRGLRPRPTAPPAPSVAPTVQPPPPAPPEGKPT